MPIVTREEIKSTKKEIAVVCLILITVFSLFTKGRWLIFHKPAYKGKIVDIDTKEPIKGVVVVAIYHKYPIISGPAGGSSTVINVREALTDKEGKFKIPSYATLIWPLSESDYTTFIIFKPGYANIGEFDMEDYFSEKGTRNQDGSLYWNKELKFRLLVNGSVELPKLKTREERLRAIPSAPTDYRAKYLPLLFKVINEENKRFGLGEAY